MQFRDKTVLITGASSGLGAELAKALSTRGVRLALFARSKEGLEATANQCAQKPLLIQGDVTHAEDCKSAVEQTIRAFGTIDYLILNAGISMWARFDEVSDPSIFRALMETNYLGPVHFTHYALPHLKKSQGMIVAISSIQGKVAVPYHTGYVASKHALQGFFDTLRSEVDIDILVASPSWIQGTRLKEHAVIQSTRRTQGKRGLALTVCVEALLSAMRQRKKELFLPKKYQLVPWLKLLCPNLLKRLIARAVRA